jgi:hypothetical protein
MDSHKDRSYQWNADTVPNIGTQQGIRIDNRPAKEPKPDIIKLRHSQLNAERPFRTQHRCGTGHVGTDRHSPETKLIIW